MDVKARGQCQSGRNTNQVNETDDLDAKQHGNGKEMGTEVEGERHSARPFFILKAFHSPSSRYLYTCRPLHDARRGPPTLAPMIWARKKSPPCGGAKGGKCERIELFLLYISEI